MIEEKDRNCSNCSYLRLNPCPHLMNTTCGLSFKYVKWAEKEKISSTTLTVTTKFDSKLDPPSEDIVEEETRKTMIRFLSIQRPMMKFKITLFIVLVVIGFLVIFVLKIMKFVSHTFFAVIILGLILFVLWGWFKNRKKKNKK